MCHSKFCFSEQIMHFPEALGVLFLQANIAWLISMGNDNRWKEYSRYVLCYIICSMWIKFRLACQSIGNLVFLLNPQYCTHL